jgi:7,8-dihydropterin-6-yl-methyl-4-(beta-D-ribofuranosyl)aminobenzene 5'-phosphate synthase
MISLLAAAGTGATPWGADGVMATQTIAGGEEGGMTHPVTDTLTITVVYDNMVYEEGLGTGWGYAAVVERGGTVLLFDTGGDGATLMANLRQLGVDPRRITAIVLSHAHGDHTGGLDSLLSLGIRPTVHVLPSFPQDLKTEAGRHTTVHDVSPGDELVEGMFTTGEVEGGVPEQALAIRTGQGLVVLTGCAHPGVGRLASRAAEQQSTGVHLVMGGFHLGSTPDREVEGVIAGLQQLGVHYVAPSHCTGDRAIQLFARAFGEQYLRSGVGRVIRVVD